MKAEWKEAILIATGTILAMLVGGLFFAGSVAFIGIIGFPAYGYLHDGVWHWMTVAELLARTGQDPVAILDLLQQCEWVGLGNFAKWFFYTSPANSVWSLAILLVVIAIAAVVRWLSIRTARMAVAEVSRGMSAHDEQAGEPLPSDATEALNNLKRGRTNTDPFFASCDALGDAMGSAATAYGFEAGRQFLAPREGETRIDLTPEEVADLAFMAHIGFRKLVNGNGSLTETVAHRWTRAVRRLEFHLSDRPDDPNERYEFAIDRDIDIYHRFRDRVLSERGVKRGFSAPDFAEPLAEAACNPSQWRSSGLS